MPIASTPSPTPPRRRPFSLTLLALTYLACSLGGSLRAYGALRSWSLLQEIGLQPGPAYFLVGGLFWLGLGLAAALGTWTGWYHSRRLALLAAGLFFASFWADRLLGAARGIPPANTLFAAVLTTAGLALAVWAASRPASRRYLDGR